MKKTFAFNYSDISKYRSALMGLSISIIMLFHCGFIPYGHIGVEFFLFISAIGLYFSLKKNDNTWSFYKRRVIRILPTYFVITIPYALVYIHYHPNENFKEFWNIIFQIRTFTETMIWSQWFISLILICYLVTPLFLKKRKYLLSYYFLIPLTLTLFSVQNEFTISYLIARFPIFIVSLKLAELVYKGKSCDLRFLIAFLAIAITGFIWAGPWFGTNLPNFNYIGLVFLILTLPILVVFTKIISYLPQMLISVLNFLGKLSLELYLCHECIRYVIIKIYMGDNPHWNPADILIVAALSLIVAIPFAYITNKTVATVRNRI